MEVPLNCPLSRCEDLQNAAQLKELGFVSRKHLRFPVDFGPSSGQKYHLSLLCMSTYVDLIP